MSSVQSGPHWSGGIYQHIFRDGHNGHTLRIYENIDSGRLISYIHDGSQPLITSRKNLVTIFRQMNIHL